MGKSRRETVPREGRRCAPGASREKENLPKAGGGIRWWKNKP